MPKAAAIADVMRKHWMIILILAFAFFLGIFRLEDCRISVDEFFSINIAQRPLSLIWSLEAHPNKFYYNRAPPFYETVLHFLWRYSKENLFYARLLSVFFNLGAVYLIFRLCALLFGKQAGIIAAFFAALNHGYLIYSKMVRWYSLLNMLCLASLYLFFKIIKRDRASIWLYIGLTVINTFILYTFYFGAFVVFLELLLAGFLMIGGKYLLPEESRDNIRRRKLCALGVCLSLSFLFLLPWSKHVLYDLSSETALQYRLAMAPAAAKALLYRLHYGIFKSGFLMRLYLFIAAGMSAYGLARTLKKDKQALWLISLSLFLWVPLFTVTFLTAGVPGDASRARYFLSFIFPFFIMAGMCVHKTTKALGIIIFLLITAGSVIVTQRYLSLPARWLWPAQLAFIAEDVRDFPLAENERAVIEIEDAYFVPVFAYYFYEPRYLRTASVPWCGRNIRQLAEKLSPNHEICFSVVGIPDYHWFNSIPQFVRAERLFLVYSDWHRDGWRKSYGQEYREVYEDKLQAYGLGDKLILNGKFRYGAFTLEIYKIKQE